MKAISLAKRLEIFPEYIFSRLSKKVREVEKESGRRVLSLAMGSPDVVPSKIYIEKFAELIKDRNAHLYPGYGAISEFENALIHWYKKRFNVLLEESKILPLLGAKDGISHLPLAIADEKDEVLIPDPGYPGFTGSTLMIGTKPIYYNLVEKNDFKIDINELKKKISRRTKFIWINFPSNPTGQVVRLDELKKIIEFARSRNIFIVYDNAYSEITFGNYIAPSILQIDGAKEVAVEIGSFSKTFSFAGFRMGWIVGNKQIIAALAKVKSQVDSGMALPLQRLGAFALTTFDKEWHKKMIGSYKGRRETIAKYLKKLNLEFSLPAGSLYIWAKIPDQAKNSEEFCMSLLREKQILLTPGTAFGKNGERYVRISICVNIDKIENYL